MKRKREQKKWKNFLSLNENEIKLVPGRVHSAEEFLIFIIHVVREAHVDLRYKSFKRKKTNQSEERA